MDPDGRAARTDNCAVARQLGRVCSEDQEGEAGDIANGRDWRGMAERDPRRPGLPQEGAKRRDGGRFTQRVVRGGHGSVPLGAQKAGGGPAFATCSPAFARAAEVPRPGGGFRKGVFAYVCHIPRYQLTGRLRGDCAEQAAHEERDATKAAGEDAACSSSGVGTDLEEAVAARGGDHAAR